MSFGLGSGPQLVGGNPGNTAPLQNPLTALITALGQLPQMRMQQQYGQEQLKSLQNQNKFADEFAQVDLATRQQQLTQAQRDNDQQDFSMLTTALQRNPQAGSNPYFKQRMQEVAQRLGYPLQVDANGNIDPDQFLKAPGEVDPKIMEQIASLPPGAPRMNAARLAGVKLTIDQANAQAAITPKDQASIAHWQAEGIHWATDDAVKTSRAQFQNELDQARTSGDYARILDMQSRTRIAQQNADANTSRAASEAERASAYAKRALDAAGGRGTIGQQLSKSYMLSAQKQLATTKDKLAAAQAALDDYASKPSSQQDTDTLNALTGKFQSAQAAYNQAVQTLNDAQTLIDQNYPQAQEVRGQAHARSVTVQSLNPRAQHNTPIDVSQATQSQILSSGPYRGQMGYLMPDGHVHLADGTDLGKP